MPQRFFLIITAVALFCSHSGNLSAQERPGETNTAETPLPLPIQTGVRWLRYALLAPLQPSATTNPNARPEDDACPEAVEILAIRERLGGSVVRGAAFDRLQDSAADRAAFDRSLADLMKVRPPTSDLPRQITPTHLPVPLGPSQLLPPAEMLNPLAAAAEQLRASARTIDSTAADLEDAGKYAEADRLREMASQLRHEARDFAQGKGDRHGVTR